MVRPKLDHFSGQNRTSRTAPTPTYNHIHGSQHYTPKFKIKDRPEEVLEIKSGWLSIRLNGTGMNLCSPTSLAIMINNYMFGSSLDLKTYDKKCQCSFVKAIQNRALYLKALDSKVKVHLQQ